MDPSSVAKEIADQFVTAWHAPVPFFIAVAVAGWLIWLAVKREYKTRLANAASTIEMLERRLNRHEADEAMAVATIRERSKVELESRPEPSKATEPGQTVKPTAPPKPTTIQEITNLFRSETDLRAQEMVRPSIGALVTLDGMVTNVMSGPTSGGISVGVALSPDGGIALCYFSQPGAASALRRGDKITVRGILVRADSLGVSFEDCELL